MTWTPIDTWIVIIGVLCAASCALVGNFLVLRKMSLMGDAISHAVLPGLAVAFLITGSRASLPMFIGAAVIGVFTAVFTEWVRKFGRVQEDASMGVVFTTLFALGLVLIVRAADSVDLDAGCVLYGALELAPLDVVNIPALGLQNLPRAVVTLASVLALNLVLVALFYKELKLSAFDPALATTLGINATAMHYLLMVMVALTTVASFESVGSILVVAMLVTPPATAYLLTQRLGVMILLSLLIAAASAALGHLSAITLPRLIGFQSTSTAGMIAAVAGLLFLLALLASPRHGLISRTAHQLLLAFRIIREDVLAMLYRVEELAPSKPPVPASLVASTLKLSRLQTTLALASLRWSGRLHSDSAGHRLTDRGRDDARQTVRSHRLWESYLASHLPLASDHLHGAAERLEHVTDPRLQDRLDSEAQAPAIDPHGRSVPPRKP